jgi:hypothetical protein
MQRRMKIGRTQLWVISRRRALALVVVHRKRRRSVLARCGR